jgi:type IV pilus assembly protein PilY1
MDVMEYQRAENRNPYYLAAKYGGFTVPKNYDITQTTTPLTQSWWDTTTSTIAMSNPTGTYPLPDNYFPAGSAGAMVSSLKSAFSSIANAITAYTTSFSLASPTVGTGESSFASQYSAVDWTSVITGATLTFDSSGNPSLASTWLSSTTLENQLAGTGWQNSRRIATWNGRAGVPFEVANLSSTQLSALAPSNCTDTTANCYTQFLNYLRGDRTYEIGSSGTGTNKYLRTRKLLLGDIVDAALVPVANPAMSYSEAHNPGYASFKSTYASRPTMVYAAANDGMLHGFVGSTGTEQFAYIPSAGFQGPSGTPQVSGLAALGNPTFVHHFYVDGTPGTFDLDLNRTGGNTSGSPNWVTLLIGGLGKGGKSYYAIDITNPNGMVSETTVAQDVKWEFTDSTMGYTYGAPIVVKTAKYGWIVALTSGYNNSDGYGYLYIVNPANGSLLEKIRTPSSSSGLTQAAAYVQDYTDYTADSIYVGDLNGQLWRFDLTGTSGSYPAPTQIASLTDASGNAQPVTTWPLIEIHPTTRMRYVMFGTGQLLSTQDVGSTAQQTLYAIIDGTAGSFNTVTTPITRANLTQVTDLTAGVTIPATSKGWYFDLSSGERMVYNRDITRYNGTVGFATLIPSVDPCAPSGSSNAYAINYATGKSVLFNTLNNSTTVVADIHLSSAVTSISFVSTASGVELIAGQTSGDVSKVPGNFTGVISTRLLNWTEMPTAE